MVINEPPPRRVDLRVYAVPVAQPRQRHRIIKGAKGQFVGNYTPKSDPVNTFKAAIQTEAAVRFDGPMLGAVDLDLVFFMPRPKAHYSSSGEIKETAPAFRSSKPDADNLAKSVMDALKDIAWKDDAQVVHLSVAKRYCTATSPVGVSVCLQELETTPKTKRQKKKRESAS